MLLLQWKRISKVVPVNGSQVNKNRAKQSWAELRKIIRKLFALEFKSQQSLLCMRQLMKLYRSSCSCYCCCCYCCSRLQLNIVQCRRRLLCTLALGCFVMSPVTGNRCWPGTGNKIQVALRHYSSVSAWHVRFCRCCLKYIHPIGVRGCVCLSKANWQVDVI